MQVDTAKSCRVVDGCLIQVCGVEYFESVMGALFCVKWFLLVAISASLLSALYLMASQGEKVGCFFRGKLIDGMRA